jgi:hypothetical protein
MEKKTSITLLLIFLVSIPVIISIPQFLILQGDVTIDGRIAAGASINFSINGTEIDSDFTDEHGNYEIFIQGFEEFFGEPFNITINGSEAEQKISYNYPQDIYLNLSALTEKALKISDSFPTNNTIEIQKTGTQIFNITTYSGYNETVNYTWFLDDNLVSNTNFYNYTIENNDTGTHNITVIATDGFLTVSKEWSLIIQRPETSSFDGDTTDFDLLGLDELGSIPNVIFEKTGKGKIEFLENLNLTGVTDLNNKVRIERGIVAIDTSFYPQLNKPARITFEGLNYKTIPEIFYNNGFTTNPFLINKKCDFCDILSYTPHPTTNGVIVFEVEHFSSFKAGESGNKYDLDLFDDLDTCKLGIVGDLVLNIKDPDEGDEFKPGEKIEIKVKIENNADENKDIVVEVYLYNIDEDDVEEETDEEEEIKDGREETFEFVLEVPDDFEDDNYLLFVKAYEDGEENLQCVERAIGIDLEREKHDVIIKDFSINPSSIVAGKSFDVFTEIQNVGERDEDVYMIIEIKELGVLTESEIFELEEFGEDDTYSETISVKVPINAEKGDYDIIVRVIFDGEEDKREDTISVLEKEPVQKETIFLNKEIIEIKEKTPLKIEKIPKVQKALEIPSAVPIALSIGIIILIILIVIMVRGKTPSKTL